MNKHLTSALTAAAAVLAVAAAPAQARFEPPTGDFDVAAGKIEHKVVVEQVSGSNAVPSHTRTESWLTRDRAHTIRTDVRSGRVLSELVATRREIRTYNGDENVIRVERRKRAGGLPINSAAFEAAIQRAYVEQGLVRVTGSEQVGGRRALVTESIPEKWNSGGEATRTTAVVDAETFTLLRRETVDNAGTYRHTQSFTVEVTDASSRTVKATMAMKKHPGAKVRDLRAKKRS